MVPELFELLVLAHIATGTTGLLSLWVPILTRKGSAPHKAWGRVFIASMVSTGAIAVGISICSLIAPLETHHFSKDAPLIRGLFGWMMMYLGVLTIALAWQSWIAVIHKRDHDAMRTPFSFAIQVAMGCLAVLCAAYGIAIEQSIMVGIAVPGLAAAILNTAFLAQRQHLPDEWLVQHFRSGIGAGISVYTAFLAFGAVNWFPALAFNPVLWAIPTVLGVAYMIHHQWQNFRQRQRRGLGRQMVAGRLYDWWFAQVPDDEPERASVSSPGVPRAGPTKMESLQRRR